MTKGDISGNGLIGARFSRNSHGNVQLPAGKKCPSLHPPTPQGWDVRSHHSQKCSQYSQWDQTSGRPYHKSRARVHISEGAVVLQPTLSGAFYPTKRPYHIWCVPHHHPHPWVRCFPFHLLMPRWWCRTSAARVQAAAVRRDRRGHCSTSIGDNLFFPTPGVTPVEPLHGEGREKWKHKSKGFHQHLLKESHCRQWYHFWKQLVLLERRKQNRTGTETNPLPKRIFFPHILSVKAGDALQMGQDLIFPAYTQVSARICCSNCLE